MGGAGRVVPGETDGFGGVWADAFGVVGLVEARATGGRATFLGARSVTARAAARKGCVGRCAPASAGGAGGAGTHPSALLTSGTSGKLQPAPRVGDTHAADAVPASTMTSLDEVGDDEGVLNIGASPTMPVAPMPRPITTAPILARADGRGVGTIGANPTHDIRSATDVRDRIACARA
jgi:hypothetical protein